LIVSLYHIHSLFPQLSHLGKRTEINLLWIVVNSLLLSHDLNDLIDACNRRPSSSNTSTTVDNEACWLKVWFVFFNLLLKIVIAAFEVLCCLLYHLSVAIH